MTSPPTLRDPLTGLGNLAAARAVLEGCVERGEPLALLYCDVDHFKWLNEVFGHIRGDEELCRIARDLERICAPCPVFRIGGDDFLVVLLEHSSEQAREVAAKILALQPPITTTHDGQPSVEVMSFSIGFALFPDHALDAEKLLRTADVALMKLKGQGGPRGPLFPDGTPIPRGNRAMTWGDFLDEFPHESAQFLNPDFVGPRI